MLILVRVGHSVFSRSPMAAGQDIVVAQTRPFKHPAFAGQAGCKASAALADPMKEKRMTFVFALPRCVPIALAFALIMSPAAQAADAQGDYGMVGAGALTCRAYMLGSTTDRTFTETWWAGYMSAMNRVTDDTYDLMGDYDADQINVLLDDYCRDNPADLFGIAVHQVMEAIFPERTR